MNLAGCALLATGPETGVWFRAIQPQYWATALSTAHTTRIPSRYSPATNTHAAFPILYLAENHLVALFEVGALLGSPQPAGGYVPNPRQPWTVLNVQVTLHTVADLSDPGEQHQLLTTAQELTGDWRGYGLRGAQTPVTGPTGLAPTQLLGAALHARPGLEGFRTLSAKVTTHRNLVLFPDKLHSGSQVVFTDPATGQTSTIP